MSHNVRKRIRWHIRAVWSETSLSAWTNFASLAIQNMCPVKILIKQSECAGWSESSLSAHVRRYIFWRCDANFIDVAKLAEKYTTDSHPIDKGFWECVKLARDSQLGISILPKHNPVPLLYYYRIPNSILQTPSQFTNYKIACSPSQDSDQLHVRLVWSESLYLTLWVVKEPKCLQVDSEDWSVDARADLSLR